MTDVCAELAAAREKRGLRLEKVAYELGISFESYRDLEWFDDEIMDNVSFETLLRLLSLLQLDPRTLFEADQLPTTTFEQLAEKLRDRAERSSLADLEEEAGWELAAAIETPYQFARMPADALNDIGKTVGIDWRELLPPEARQPPSPGCP